MNTSGNSRRMVCSATCGDMFLSTIPIPCSAKAGTTSHGREPAHVSASVPSAGSSTRRRRGYIGVSVQTCPNTTALDNKPSAPRIRRRLCGRRFPGDRAAAPKPEVDKRGSLGPLLSRAPSITPSGQKRRKSKKKAETPKSDSQTTDTQTERHTALAAFSYAEHRPAPPSAWV